MSAEEFFPVDLISLASSDSDGTCFIQTSSLDGEKNLKPRSSIKETQDEIGRSETIRILGELFLPTPNSNLYDVKGSISIGGERRIKIDVKHFMLRGSVLKNTEWVIGVCAYTGKDTKIMKNAEESKYKQSNVEKKTNSLILMIFLFQVFLCIALAILRYIWSYRHG